MMMEGTTADLRGRLNHINSTMAAALEAAGETFDFSRVGDDLLPGSDAKAKLEKFQAMDAEANEIGEEISRRNDLKATGVRIADGMKPVEHPGHPSGGTTRRDAEKAAAYSSPGSMFTESASYKRFDTGESGSFASAEIPGLNFRATTFDTAGATLTVYDRPPGIVLLGQRTLTVADLLAQGQTTANTIRYVKEDTFTNAATTVAEGGTKPEAAWDTSEVDSPVRKIAVTSKVTDELFADFPMIRDYIDNRMRFMVLLTEDDQLLNGNGTPPNLRGILQTSGIQTQALGADTRPDAVFKATIKVLYTGFFPVDGIVLNPTDWQNIRLLKDSAGNYLYDGPADSAVPRLWGYPVVVTPTIAAGTGLVGSFQLGAQVWYREGMRVESTNSNEDDFKKNLIAIRAEQREALAVYRPTAFCSVTGL